MPWLPGFNWLNNRTQMLDATMLNDLRDLVNALEASINDPDLTTIAALAPANNDLLQRKSGAWTNRTPAQVKTDLAISTADVSGLTAQITAAVTALVNGAPGALDTLKELADALGDDANFATTVTNALAGKAQGFVPTAIKTSAYTAAAGDFVVIDTTASTVPITLPTNPPDGTRVGGKVVLGNVVGSQLVNAATFTCGGTNTFNKTGGATVYTQQLLSQAVNFQFKSGIWYVTADDMPLSQLDARYKVRDNKRAVRLASSLSRPTQRMLYPSLDAPTVSYVASPTNSQILTSTPILTGVLTNATDVIANGLVSVMGACNPQHATASWPDTLIYRFYDSVLTQLNTHSRLQFSLHFYSDSDKVEMIHKNIGAGAYRIWVDDQAVGSLTPTTFASTGTIGSIMVSFPTAKVRRYRIDYSNADFVGMFVTPKYNLWAAEQRGPTAFFMGDSYFGGSGMSTSAIAQMPNYLGTLYGIDNVYNFALGGTGYVEFNGSGGFDNSALPQVQYLAPAPGVTPSLTVPGSALPTPDLVVLEWGHNDTWNSTVQTVASNTIAAARAQWPNAFIVLTGPLGAGAYATTWLSVETTLFANNARLVDATISMWQGQGRPWLTGTGTTAAPTGTGNGDLYTGSDGVHLNDAGIAYMSEHFAPVIHEAVRSLAA